MKDNQCGGLFNRGVCKMTKKQFIKFGLNPVVAEATKCQFLKKGKCVDGLKVKVRVLR